MILTAGPFPGRVADHSEANTEGVSMEEEDDGDENSVSTSERWAIALALAGPPTEIEQWETIVALAGPVLPDLAAMADTA